MNAKLAIERCPRKVWIGTAEYTIEFVPPTHEDLRPDTDGSSGNDGSCDVDKGHIVIAETLPLSKLAEIAWHEIEHALNWEEDIEDGVDEETLTRKHGRAWSQFFINNPRFGRWWLSLCVAIRKERQSSTRKEKK